MNDKFEQTGKVWFVEDGEDALLDERPTEGVDYSQWLEWRQSNGDLVYINEDGQILSHDEFWGNL